jgi:hypothetical protein
VIAALAKCAEDQRDIFLRELTAHALNFWEGTPEEQKMVEQTLLKRTTDTGAGHENRSESKEGE